MSDLADAVGSGRPAPDSEARERLLDALVDHVSETGLSDQTLRGLAEAVGTSHRMLIYHFGSRAGLHTAIADRTAERQRQTVRDLGGTGQLGLSPGRPQTELWTGISRGVRNDGALLFELWVRAMSSAPEADRIRTETMVASLEPLQAYWTRHGYSASLATPLATLQLAVGRGLILDRLLDGDDRALTEAVSLLDVVVNPLRVELHGLEALLPAVAERARTGVSLGPGPVLTEPARPTSSAREQLLDQLMAKAAQTGVADLSLRQMAAAADTSHRMLIYHFGSREGLLDELVSRIERQHAHDLAILVATDVSGHPNNARFTQLWNRILDRLDRDGPLIFELAVQASRGTRSVEQIRTLLIDSFLRPFAQFWSTQGYSPARADQVARLHVAAARGLMMQYLLHRQREETLLVLGIFGVLFVGAPGVPRIEETPTPRPEPVGGPDRPVP